MNSLTGGDPIKARGLRKDLREFPMLATLVVLTNPLPRFTDVNEAALRRPVVEKFPYAYKYEEELDIQNPNHKLRNDDLADELKAKNIKLQFMNLMMDYYPIYEKEGLQPSKYISDVTNEYKFDLDEVKKWAMDNLVYVEGQRVSTKEVHERMMMDEGVEEEMKRITLSDFTKKLKANYKVERRSYKSLNQSIIFDYILKVNVCKIVEVVDELDELEIKRGSTL
jgi:phage/plasmid-associated DNA primase